MAVLAQMIPAQCHAAPLLGGQMLSTGDLSHLSIGRGCNFQKKPLNHYLIHDIKGYYESLVAIYELSGCHP